MLVTPAAFITTYRDADRVCGASDQTGAPVPASLIATRATSRARSHPSAASNGFRASRRGSTTSAPQEAELSLEAPYEAAQAPTVGDLAAVADQLL